MQAEEIHVCVGGKGAGMWIYWSDDGVKENVHLTNTGIVSLKCTIKVVLQGTDMNIKQYNP